MFMHMLGMYADIRCSDNILKTKLEVGGILTKAFEEAEKKAPAIIFIDEVCEDRCSCI
jgi:hypothetical protein